MEGNGSLNKTKNTITRNGSFTNLLNSKPKLKSKQYIEFFKYDKQAYKVSSCTSLNNDNSNDSVLFLDVNKSFTNQLLAVKSNYEIRYLSVNNTGITDQISYLEHEGRINDTAYLKNPEQNEDQKHAFFSVSDDGMIKLWDIRAKNSVHTIKSKTKSPFYSIDTSSKYFAVGSHRELSIYDLTTMKEYKKSKFFHSTEINSVKFVQSNGVELLLTGGEDDIINVLDINDGLTINSIVVTANIGQSIDKLEPFDEALNYVQAITTVQTFNVINLNNSSSIFEFDAKNETYNTDYILKSYTNLNNNQIVLVCGNYQGHIVFMNLNISNKEIQIFYETSVSTGFSGAVNSIELINDSMFVAGCDEGNIYTIEKNNNPIQIPDDLSDLGNDEPIGPIKLKNNKFIQKYKPY